MSGKLVHAHETCSLGGEFTVCGIAFDAFASGDVDEETVFAEPGEIVTCPDCQRTIDFMKTFKRYRQP